MNKTIKKQPGLSAEKVEYVNVTELVPFKDHPFQSRDGEEKETLTQSIKAQGAIEPLIVRPISEGKYEIISGHRRMEVCKELGVIKLPVIIRHLSDEQAVSMMVDANLHRESILPSERAFAYKMKLDAVKKQGHRSDLTSSQVGTRFRSDEEIAKSLGIGKETLHRYIRLTELIPELLRMVDEKRIALTPAVELSYLTKAEQTLLYDEIEYADATPNLSQAQRLRSLSKQGRLGKDDIFSVISEEKANQKEQIRFLANDIRKFFPKSYTNSDMQQTILKLLEKWQRNRNREAR